MKPDTARGTRIAIGFILLLAAVYALRGLWALHQGEYWDAPKYGPPILYTGTKAALIALAQIATGAAVAAAAMTQISDHPRRWWAGAIALGLATLIFYLWSFFA